MAAEIPPDYFPTSPTLAGSDSFPDDMSVPAAGIFDTPAHVAIINQDWVARLLGVFDGLMYPEAWEAIGAETAYNELLELQAMIMSPANLLIPSDTFSFAVSQLNLPGGNPSGTVFIVPTGKIYQVTEVGIMHTSATISADILFASELSVQRFLIHQPSPTSLQMYARSIQFWLRAGGSINWQVVNATAGDDLRVHVNGLVYDEV